MTVFYELCDLDVNNTFPFLRKENHWEDICLLSCHLHCVVFNLHTEAPVPSGTVSGMKRNLTTGAMPRLCAKARLREDTVDRLSL